MPQPSARPRQPTPSRISVVPPRTLPNAPRRAPLGVGPALLAALATSVGLSAAGWHLTRGPVRREHLAEHHAPAAVRDDLVLRARPAPIPEGALDGRECADATTRWVFPRATREALALTLGELLRDPAHARAAMARARCDDAGCVVEPDGRLVESLPAETRVRLLAALGQDASNPSHFSPHRRALADLPFADSPGLPPASREAVARLSWSDAGVRLFTDLPAACAHAATPAARRALVRAIYRPMTWDVALRTALPSANRLVGTFPVNERVRVRATLARARAAGLASIPLDGLLPPGVRRWNGAWPAPGAERSGSLAISLRAMDARDPESARRADAELEARYARVDDARPHLGDVMVLRMADYTVEGAVVHLTAGMVFVPPDAAARRPGRIAPLEEVLLDHPYVWRVEAWRRRAADPQRAR